MIRNTKTGLIAYSGLALLFSAVFSSCSHKKSEESYAASDPVFKNMDTTVHPGNDFFKYANGGWIKKNPIPAAYSSWGIGNLVQEEIREKLKKINEDALKENAAKGTNSQKIADFYFSGMDTVGIEKRGISDLKAELDRIDQIKDVNGVLDVSAHLTTYGVENMIGLYIGQDEKNSDKIALHISQSGIGLPNRDYYFNTDTRTKNIRNDYSGKHLPAVLKLSGMTDQDATAAAKNVFAIETALAASSRKLEDLRDPYHNYNKMSIAKLNQLTPGMNWTDIFQKLKINKADTVIVGQPEYYQALNKALKTFPIKDWKAYLRWHLISATSPYLNKDLDKEKFRFYGTVIAGKKEQLPRWKRVLDAENALMGEVLGQLFVKAYFPEAAKKRYSDMVTAIRSSYKEHIEKLDWMSAETKKKALDKLEKIHPKVGFPDKWKDFSTLEIDRKSYVLNVLRAQAWWYNREVNKLGKPVDRTEWDMTPQTYNAYYNPSNNEIVLPAAIFSIAGVKDEDVDDAVVYGYAAASTIGHEITHGFDDEGRQFDAKGNLKAWWTPQDSVKFTERAQVLVNQFNNYKVLDSMHVNGKATLGENIADLGGIVLGLDAFKKTEQYKENKKINGLTPLQRYFLGYALGWLGHQRDEQLASQILTDVHSPAFLRVNGPFADVPEFYEAFKVKKGDAMWIDPDKRVKIW